MTDAVVGVDVGGSGSRILVECGDERWTDASAPAGTTRDKTFDAIVAAVARGVAMVGADEVRAVGVGATRVVTYFADLPELRARLREVVSAPTVIASDLVSTHLGALDGEHGVTLAAGTGAVVLAESLDGELHRVDGWGHLLGDVGSGAWIGQRALALGLAVRDGREAPRGDLLVALEADFGPADGWPRRLYEANDRARVMATLVPVVLAAAQAGDGHAIEVVAAAAEGLARSVRAGLEQPGVPSRVALAGGLFGAPLLREAVRAHLADIDEVVDAKADSTAGALELARRAARGERTPDGGDNELISWP